MKQPWAWVIWLAMVLVTLTITRNPLYLIIILLCVLFVGLALRRAGSELLRPISLWKLALWIILLAAVFNTLTSHFGETVMFTIPGKLPLVSGKITLEAMVYGAMNGLILTGILASFSVLNLALPVRELISLIPRAFFPVAVVTSIAITYLPTTMRQFQQIREAQAVRGHQMRTIKDWLPLLMPLLVGGLEHAMQLAEAMTARGFASAKTDASQRQILPRSLMLVGILVLALGWLIQLVMAGWKGWPVILAGAMLILLGLWLTGRQYPRTAYHRHGWSWQDGLGISGALAVLAVYLLPISSFGSETLYYNPYPKLTLPLFSPLIGLVMLAFLVPGVLVLKREHRDSF